MGEIADLIKASGAVKRGTFTLSDGSLRDYYVDKYVFETDPEVLAAVTDELVAHIDPDAVDLVAGPALGAVPLVTAVSLDLGVDSVFVRKGEGLQGTQARVEGAVDKGMRTVVVEDVTMTGATAVESAQVLEASGAVVEEILAVVDRNEGAADRVEAAGYDFTPLVSVGQDMDVA
ncbi:MAG: orotate phosphoribosyltransferase [Haloferacaceae archaeon]